MKLCKIKLKGTSHTKLCAIVPTFDEARIEEFFVAFEKLADKLQWEESSRRYCYKRSAYVRLKMPSMLLTLTNANLTIL